jgi:hypothetical protein
MLLAIRHDPAGLMFDSFRIVMCGSLLFVGLSCSPGDTGQEVEGAQWASEPTTSLFALGDT